MRSGTEFSDLWACAGPDRYRESQLKIGAVGLGQGLQCEMILGLPTGGNRTSNPHPINEADLQPEARVVRDCFENTPKSKSLK